MMFFLFLLFCLFLGEDHHEFRNKGKPYTRAAR